jgi:hypothetical protein
METLVSADAHLHSVHWEKGKGEEKAEAEITTILFRASQVAHSLCESALARVEPFYDTHTAGNVAADSASCFCSCSCRSLVSSALKNADTVVTALEHASKHLSTIVSLPLSDFCGNEAMRAAIDSRNLGAISLAVVLLLELPSLAPPLQLVHHALYLRNKSTETIAHIVCILLTVPAIAASACNEDTNDITALMLASKKRHAEMVTALLACPVISQSAGAVNKNGNTALMFASRSGRTETVAALLAFPTVVQSAGAANKNGDTALMFASANGDIEIVNALLACPTVVESVGAFGSNGFTALKLAQHYGHDAIIQVLRKI